MIEQGTTQWLQQRLGRVTASRISDVVARTKSGWGASRANYLTELLIERLTGQPAEHYVNGAMQWGIDTEPQARLDYQMMFDVPVETVGFVSHPTIAAAGASPDGFAGEGLVEIKCANSATHVETLLTEKIPSKYLDQMQFQMAVTGRPWCDYVSYDPRLPPTMQLFVKRVQRDQDRIDELEKHVVQFLRELDAEEAELRHRYGSREAA